MSSSSYYKLLLFTLMVLFLASCASKKGTVDHRNKTIQNDIVDYSKKYLNKPYRYAGKGPNSFDCSGYTSFVFGKFGYNLHPSSSGQDRQVVTIRTKEDLVIGDLVFFEGRSHKGRVGHVGIVTDVNKRGNFKFIHASTSNGVIISSSEEAYYKARYLRGGRVLKDIPKEPKALKVQESTTAENNYEKSQDQVVYKETAGELALLNTPSGMPMKEETMVSPEQISKPVKSKNKEEKKKKNDGEIRQQAIRRSEESPIFTSTRISHKVKPGETLFSISQMHNCSVEQLKQWNPEIENNVIQAGDVLDIHQ